MNRILLSLFIIVAFSFGWQSNGIAQDAKLNKLVKLYFKGKEQKAVDKLWKLARKNDEFLRMVNEAPLLDSAVDGFHDPDYF